MKVDFTEDTYGILKRLRTIENWLVSARGQFQRPLTILDFGCGTGDYLTYPLAIAGYAVVGVDCHARSIHEAKRRFPLNNLNFRVATVDDLIREGATFDAVICSEVLEHLEQPCELLLSFRRVLNDKGALIITVPNGSGCYEILRRFEARSCRSSWYQWIRKTFHVYSANHSTNRLPPLTLNQDSIHIQFFSELQIEALFSSAGYRILERRARTLVCGPYIDPFIELWPFRQKLYRLNGKIADVLPFRFAADWMFLLEVQPSAK